MPEQTKLGKNVKTQTCFVCFYALALKQTQIAPTAALVMFSAELR